MFKYVVKRYGKLTTSELLAKKLKLNITASFVKALKLGILSSTGIFISQVVKAMFSQTALANTDHLCILLSVFGLAVYLICDIYEAYYQSVLNLCNDLLNIRLARTGTKA